MLARWHRTLSLRRHPLPAAMQNLVLLLLFSLFHNSIPLFGFEIVCNGFDPSDFLRFGGSAFQHLDSGGRRYLSAAKASRFSAGRVFYKSKITTRGANKSASGSSTGHALPFHSSFIFSISRIPGILPGHGITFLFSPRADLEPGTESQQLGLFNFTTNANPSNGVFAVEFDVFENAEFNDIDNNHVGVDIYSLTSVLSHTAGYWKVDDGSSHSSFVGLSLNDGTNYQAWIDYSDAKLNVTMAIAGSPKPSRPLISVNRDLTLVFKDEMYVGFTASTGRLVENHRILGWSFSNTNSSLSKELITNGLPNFVVREKSGANTVVIAGVTSALAIFLIIASVLLLLCLRRLRRRKADAERDEVGDAEEWELEYWPHRIGYKEILSATNGFSDDNLVGCGGNGTVYKGNLAGAPVAVKLFSCNTGEQARVFLAEVSSLGRLKHRNIVGLKGWCRKGGGDLILVYEYMENGSLDKRIFCDGSSGKPLPPLDWGARMRILKDVAAGILYLHEGWESKVLHRDIKSSNVLLDGNMVGRLGDFGLARIHPHGDCPRTTKVVGTVGYMAPELVRRGKSTAATDVYGFGVLMLEVVFGRRPVVEGAPELIEFAWEAAAKGLVAEAVDDRVKGMDGFDEEEAGRTVKLALLCTCAEARERPTIRQVVRTLDWGRFEDGVEESPEACLIEKLRTTWRPAAASAGNRGKRDLTFEEVKRLMFGSAELSASDLIVEGR